MFTTSTVIGTTCLIVNSWKIMLKSCLSINSISHVKLPEPSMEWISLDLLALSLKLWALSASLESSHTQMVMSVGGIINRLNERVSFRFILMDSHSRLQTKHRAKLPLKVQNSCPTISDRLGVSPSSVPRTPYRCFSAQDNPTDYSSSLVSLASIHFPWHLL